MTLKIKMLMTIQVIILIFEEYNSQFHVDKRFEKRFILILAEVLIEKYGQGEVSIRKCETYELSKQCLPLGFMLIMMAKVQ